MKNSIVRRIALQLALAMTIFSFAGYAGTEAPSKKVKAEAKKKAPKADEIQQLKEMVQQLSDTVKNDHEQIQQLHQQLDARDQQLRTATTQATQEAQQAQQAATEAAKPGNEALKQVAEVKTAQTATETAVKADEKKISALESPIALKYKGITITPAGFFAAEALFRNHAENADMNTSWNSIPFSAAPMSHQTEFRASSRNTRLALKAEGMAGKSKLTGYFETDFLGAGYGANEQQSNGYSNRVRQMWVGAALPGGWNFSAGQMWSLLTTNRKGIANLGEWTTPLIDGSQFLGHDYARQTGFRIVKSLDGNKVTLGFSVENAATVAVIPANVPSSISGRLSGLSTTGTGALSNTTYSTNAAPDLIFKVAVDPGYGHYELKMIGRTFRDRLTATTTLAGHNDTRLAGAIGGAAYLPLIPQKAEIIVEGMYGAIGRYGATSTDAVVKPTGYLSAEKSTHAFVGIETHPTPKLDWYVLASGEFLPRNYGYGLATINNTACKSEAGFSCSANVKSLEGLTSGIWYNLYKGSYGTFKYGLNYAYILKTTWVGVGGAPHATEAQAETSFRYYLP